MTSETKKSSETKSRKFCFTINNPTESDLENCKKLSENTTYFVIGLEKGKEGTEHYQGFLYHASQVRFNAIKKALPRAHIEICKGNIAQNIAYCKKDGNVILERGEAPNQGKRTDIEDARQLAKESGKMRDIVEKAQSYQSIKCAEIYLKYHEKPRTWKPEVRWYHGSTGSGKTRAAREWLGDDCYTALDSIKWWEGYDGHENVLIDDFRKDFCKFHQLLKLLDRYEYKVETKGGSRQFLAKKIAITSPFPPDEQYDNREDIKQLMRRISDIILVGERVIGKYREEEIDEREDYLERKMI